MKMSIVLPIGLAISVATLLSATMPAQALGGCGPNRHLNLYGYCVLGGQNQAWCLRHAGHDAGYGFNGTRWCR